MAHALFLAIRELADERDDAAEARPAPARGERTQALEQQRDAAGVVEPETAEARRVQSGRAVERVDLEPGVVAERGAPRQPPRRARFAKRVLGVGRARLLGQRRARDLDQTHELDRQVAEQARQLPPLTGIPGRENE